MLAVLFIGSTFLVLLACAYFDYLHICNQDRKTKGIAR